MVDHKKSTKQPLDMLDGQTTKLCDTVETLEKKVETTEAGIRKWNIQLDESRMICTAMIDVVAIFSDLQEEMKFVNALRQLTSGASGSKQHVPQASSNCEVDSEEDDDIVGAFSLRYSTISHQVTQKDGVQG
ncbi:Uncharacterized protein Adt_31150 [Abeliophyllum distichum]|uniref:Uncharacterized protein n=1 Tax=Abeliophyllum distichum TaxID=126358 RepID=A0ABD1RD88_9LAMI